MLYITFLFSKNTFFEVWFIIVLETIIMVNLKRGLNDVFRNTESFIFFFVFVF